MSALPDHLRAQGVLVRMFYDPRFAAAVVADPDRVLASLSQPLREQLASIDVRALRRDRHRVDRTLALLCEELSCTCALIVQGDGDPQRLRAFFGSSQFHEAIEDRRSLVLSFGAFIRSWIGGRGAALDGHVAALLEMELACARARRAGVETKLPLDRLRRAPGVEPVEVPSGALETLRAMRSAPPGTIVGDLPPLGPGRATLAAVELDGEVSLVEIARPLYAILCSLPGPRTRAAVLEEATLRIAGDRAAAEAALASLVEDELVLTS